MVFVSTKEIAMFYEMEITAENALIAKQLAEIEMVSVRTKIHSALRAYDSGAHEVACAKMEELREMVRKAEAFI